MRSVEFGPLGTMRHTMIVKSSVVLPSYQINLKPREATSFVGSAGGEGFGAGLDSC